MSSASLHQFSSTGDLMFKVVCTKLSILLPHENRWLFSSYSLHRPYHRMNHWVQPQITLNPISTPTALLAYHRRTVDGICLLRIITRCVLGSSVFYFEDREEPISYMTYGQKLFAMGIDSGFNDDAIYVFGEGPCINNSFLDYIKACPTPALLLDTEKTLLLTSCLATVLMSSSQGAPCLPSSDKPPCLDVSPNISSNGPLFHPLSR